MFETFRYETSRRLRGTAVLTIGITLYAGFVTYYYTALEGVNYEELLEQYPPAMMEAFGIETLSTIEGFLGAQMFNFVWLLGLGIYFAYTASSLIAGDIETDRMDLLVSFPISRSQLLLEKFASLLFPLIMVNFVTGSVIYGMTLVIGETIDVTHLIVVHLLSIPYLLVCAAIGLVCSVLVDRATIAERAAGGLVFVLFLVESVVGTSTNFEVISYISPTNYYNPTPVLIDGSYQILDTVVLLAAFLVLLIVGQILFQRRDI
jgi:ABC-2 type transport system permease protein